jgi:hypothetical protein
MSMKINPVILQILNVIAVITVIVVNSLANILPLNGVTTGLVSDSFPNFFTPAGYVFSIWFIIYLQAIIFVIYQVRKSQREQAYIGQIGIFYFLGGLANIGWIFLFHYSANPINPPFLYGATVLLLVLFLLLLLIYIRIGIGQTEVPRSQRLAIHLHISVYIAWLSVASIAGIASALNTLLPGLPDPTQWIGTAVMLVIALVLTLLMTYQRREFGFGLVVVWAAIGIAVKHFLIPVIMYTAIAVAIVGVLAILLIPFLKKMNFVEFYLGAK